MNGMFFVLWVYATGAGMSTAEYNSLAACETAKVAVVTEFDKYGTSHISAVCTPRYSDLRLQPKD